MEKWQLLSFTLRWPHQGLILGFETFEPDEQHNYYTVKVHLLFLSVGFEWGYGDNPYI